MDGIPALDLWDLGIEALHYSSNQPRARVNLLRDEHYEEHSNKKTKKQSDMSEEFGWTNVDYVTPSAKLFRLNASFFVDK